MNTTTHSTTYKIETQYILSNKKETRKFGDSNPRRIGWRGSILPIALRFAVGNKEINV